MELICKREALNEKGEKIMNFTKGDIYIFGEIEDPPGWQTLDDNCEREVFFDLDVMFEKMLKNKFD